MLPQEFLNKYHLILLKSFSLKLFTFYDHDKVCNEVKVVEEFHQKSNKSNSKYWNDRKEQAIYAVP